MLFCMERRQTTIQTSEKAKKLHREIKKKRPVADTLI